MDLSKLPISALKRINKHTYKHAPYTLKLSSNGKVKVSNKVNITNNKEFGKRVLPLSVMTEVQKNIKTKLKQKPSKAYPLRSRLSQNIVSKINKELTRGGGQSSPKSPPPLTHYKAKKTVRKLKPILKNDNTSRVHWLNKKEYLPVYWDDKKRMWRKGKLSNPLIEFKSKSQITKGHYVTDF